MIKALTTTERSGVTEFVNVTGLPFSKAYTTPAEKRVTVNTGPMIWATI
jgi:hypothetical protein